MINNPLGAKDPNLCSMPPGGRSFNVLFGGSYGVKRIPSGPYPRVFPA